MQQYAGIYLLEI